ncbi:hypothetical protein [Poritiphilus flavus]|uniref:Right handed beta helix region n=1 Tax=Poritiphilus flavus TaxID=2697053 RepID=A0A6L9EAE4_9FLAO|nr:hypothetical protein [Poritiphilus flavus]NAS11518.1 hypothetical protein [Poritiphilus flavus]
MNANYINNFVYLIILALSLVLNSCSKDSEVAVQPETITETDPDGGNEESEEEEEQEEENDPDSGNEDFTIPEGSYYVTVDGSASNDGLSEANAWSIEHAFSNARAGDHVFIRSGDYGNVELQPGHSGTSDEPIRFIGYRSEPGDISANNGSTFNYGDDLNANDMPLLRGNRVDNIGQGSGIFNFHSHIQISNIQITHYAQGVFSSGANTVLDNVIVTEVGDFNPAHTFPDNTSDPTISYAGIGINVTGDYSIIKNCFVLNAGAEGFRFSDCQYQKHSYNKVYSDSFVNPCDYYYLLALGADNNELDNIYVERIGEIQHLGHGLILKFDAKGNDIRDCTIKNTWLELSYSEVSDNQFTNCDVIGGGPKNEGALLIANGAHHNTFTQCSVVNCDGVAFSDWDEDFSRGDVRNAGHNNTFEQCVFDNNRAGMNFFWFDQEQKDSPAHDNVFNGCTISNTEHLFLVDRINTDNALNNCTLINITNLRGSTYETLNSGLTLDAVYQNNTLENCGFSLD